MSAKGLFLVPEFQNFKKNSGAYVHTKVSFKELSKDFDLTWYNKPEKINSEEIKSNPSKKKKKSNIIKGSIKDLILILKELYSVPHKVTYLKKSNYDFIYYRLNYLGFGWVIAARLSKTPIFLEVNGIFSKDIKMYQKSLLNGLVKAIEKWVYKNANHGFYVGGINIEMGINKKNCSIIQNGIWLKEIKPIDKTQVDNKYSNNSDKIKLVFVGHIMNHHRIDIFILSEN